MSRIFPRIQEKPRNGTSSFYFVRFPLSNEVYAFSGSEVKQHSLVPVTIESLIPYSSTLLDPRGELTEAGEAALEQQEQIALARVRASKENAYFPAPSKIVRIEESQSRKKIRVIRGANLVEVPNWVVIRYGRELFADQIREASNA